MRNIHSLSGLTVAVFVALHLSNHVSGLYGAERHMAVMDTLRLFYRNPVAETVLVAAVVVQIVSGLALFRAVRKTAATPFGKLHRWTGLYLAFFLAMHLGAVLGGRFLLRLDTNYYFGVAGLNSFPANLFFIPYYGLAILSFFGHAAAIHRLKMKRTLLGLSPARQSALILAAGFLLTAVVFYSLTNRFAGVEIPDEYKVLTGGR